MHRSLAFALTAAVLVTHSGCATSYDPRRHRLPPPPSEEVRSQLGTVRVSGTRTDAALVFTAPAKGAGEGALRGAGLGSIFTIGGVTGIGGKECFPLCTIAGIALAPVGALVGAVVGAARAEPAATVKEKETALRGALEELKVPEAVGGCVADALDQRTSQLGAVVSADERASTILEVVVERFGLDADWSINPPLRFVLTERTRLIRASDGAELYKHWLTYRGPDRPLDHWVAQSAATLREEATRACRELAERLVDEVFLLYLPGEEPQRGGR